MREFGELLQTIKPVKYGRTDIPMSNFEIILEDCVFDYHLGKLETFCKLWEEGWSIKTIGKKMGLSQVNVTLIAIDRDLKGKIKPRKGGIYGSKS